MPVQAMSVQNGLGLIVFFGCSIFLSLAIMIFSKFSIRRADVLKVQMILDRDKKDALDSGQETFEEKIIIKAHKNKL